MNDLKKIIKKVVLNVNVPLDLRREALEALLQDAKGSVHIFGDVYVSKMEFAQILEHLRDDKKIRAIKVMRDCTDLSLMVAKIEVERIMEEMEKGEIV